MKSHKEIIRLGLDDLWRDVRDPQADFNASAIGELPPGARRYLQHAIAPGTPLASAVRLTMHGAIKLDGTWSDFEAEQVIRWDRGLIWKAKTSVRGLPVTGSDRVIDGQGAMRWKLLGVIPVVKAGPNADISRSASGRLEAESMWIPSVLVDESMRWTENEPNEPHVTVTVPGDTRELTLSIADDGRLQSLCLRRWGDVDGGAFHEIPFGAVVEDEGTFEGYTIPTRLRVGWYFGTDRFEDEGEFWRATITSATYR